MDQQRLIDLYAELSALTNPLCAACPKPHSCCELAGCENARTWAMDVYGLTLKQSKGPLPFLTETGCTVAPHHRPICSFFLCPDAAKRAPARWAELRAEIALMEAGRWR